MIDWDAELLTPVMSIFGEGTADQSTWPIYIPVGLPAFRLADAVFDRAYSEVVIEGEDAGSTTKKPCLGVRVSLFDQMPQQNDRVYIPSVDTNFIVKNVEADGHGHAKLMLMASK
jgi:hypothetical protein